MIFDAWLLFIVWFLDSRHRFKGGKLRRAVRQQEKMSKLRRRGSSSRS
jgi:hypothetical protein